MATPTVQKLTRLPVDLARRLETYARENELAENQVITTAIRDYLASYDPAPEEQS